MIHFNRWLYTQRCKKQGAIYPYVGDLRNMENHRTIGSCWSIMACQHVTCHLQTWGILFAALTAVTCLCKAMCNERSMWPFLITAICFLQKKQTIKNWCVFLFLDVLGVGKTTSWEYRNTCPFWQNHRFGWVAKTFPLPGTSQMTPWDSDWAGGTEGRGMGVWEFRMRLSIWCIWNHHLEHVVLGCVFVGSLDGGFTCFCVIFTPTYILGEMIEIGRTYLSKGFKPPT